MSDLIRRSDAIEAVENNSYGMGSRASVKAIKALPSAEAVQVVRCRDCKWYGHIGCAIEIKDDSDRPKPNDFCSFGERRTK